MHSGKIDYTTVEIDGIIHVTEKAALVRFPNMGEEKFVPRSVLSTDIDKELDEDIVFYDIENLKIATWFVDKEELY